MHNLIQQVGIIKLVDKLTKLEVFKYLTGIFRKTLNIGFQVRVLCVTEMKDNLCMWSHYADNHRCAMMKLRCIDELDNTLLIARKVTYSENVPIIGSLDDMVNHFLCTYRIELSEDLRHNLAYTKSNHWSYENEWRVSYPMPDLS